MKSSITIHHGHGPQHEWLRELVQKHFDKILWAVEKKVRAEKIGLPWQKEDRLEFESGFSWELDEGFEISSAFMDDNNKGGGACWMLNDFWMQEAPPEEEDE